MSNCFIEYRKISSIIFKNIDVYQPPLGVYMNNIGSTLAMTLFNDFILYFKAWIVSVCSELWSGLEVFQWKQSRFIVSPINLAMVYAMESVAPLKHRSILLRLNNASPSLKFIQFYFTGFDILSTLINRKMSNCFIEYRKVSSIVFKNIDVYQPPLRVNNMGSTLAMTLFNDFKLSFKASIVSVCSELRSGLEVFQ